MAEEKDTGTERDEVLEQITLSPQAETPETPFSHVSARGKRSSTKGMSLPPSSPDQRREALILALRTLRDAGETLQRGDGGGRFEPGSRALIMPAAWHAGCPPECIGRGGNDIYACRATYAELLRALDTLRRRGPAHYRAVSARYLRSTRQTRELATRQDGNPKARVYSSVVRHVTYANGEPHYRYETTEPLPRNSEVLAAITEPKATVARKPGGPRMMLVRAVVETWDASVETAAGRRCLERGLDFLQAYMPREIRLPRMGVAA